MTKGKRPHIPKVKGCYECSQRRIHCDRGEPSCNKCISKNLRCSGLGIRYRFSNGTPLRLDNSSKFRIVHARDDRCRPRSGTPDCCRTIGKGGGGGDNVPHGDEFAEKVDQTRRAFKTWTDCLQSRSVSASTSARPILSGAQTAVEWHSLWTTSQKPRTDIAGAVKAGFTTPDESVKPWQRYLLSYYADRIASELVVIDDRRNGWRYLVLPVAHVDTLVMNAVLSAAAFHFSANVGECFGNPDTFYAKAIRGLRERHDLERQDVTNRQSVLLALLVLLATVMVNGRSDFPMIFNLIESAVDVIGGEETLLHGELGFFVVRQIRKLRGYAAPLLSQRDGFARLKLTSSTSDQMVNGWECFDSYYHSHPELQPGLSSIYELNKQACDIYVTRALAGPDGPPLIDMVEKFRASLQSLSEGNPGEHVLVFATFIAAAESTLPDHQEYFSNALVKHHQRNGFGNIRLALEHLKKIWSGGTTQDWTQLLPQLRLFIV